jgi:hypothetical protein
VNSRVLAAAYLLIGLACALPELLRASQPGTPARRLSMILSALLTVILWPLWAPFALAPGRPGKRRRTTD